MKTQKHRTKQLLGRPPIRQWYRWHRRLGIISALFVILLSITGILLNHNVTLDLNKKFITNNWLISLYGYDTNTPYAHELLTYDQLIIDIHAGRFMGAAGPIIMDIVALIFLALAISGTYIWLRRNTPPKQKTRPKK